MKAYKVELLIIDFDNLGENGVKEAIENASFSNRCISPDVKKITEKDIGPWDDSHPLNNRMKCDEEYKKLFGQ